jgi:starch synthase
MYSLKYGTIPIVRATGGLADTITDVDAKQGTGTGFVFEEYESKEMFTAIKRALTLFKKKRLWSRVMKEAMEQDFSWKRSALKYSELYCKALARVKCHA